MIQYDSRGKHVTLALRTAVSSGAGACDEELEQEALCEYPDIQRCVHSHLFPDTAVHNNCVFISW